MPNNPYPDEPMRMAPTEALSQTERMENIPLRQPTPVAATPAPVKETLAEAETVEATQEEETRTVRYSIGRLSDFLQWFVGVLEIALALRFLLKLIGAQETNPFALILYVSTNIVLYPFNGIIRTLGGFEPSTLIAMLVYALTLWAIKRFLRILITNPEETAG